MLKDSGNLLGHNDLDHPYLRAYYSTGRTLAVDKQPSIPLTKRTTSRWRAPPILVQRASHLFPTRVRCLLTRLTLDTRVQQQLSKTILRSPSSSGACSRWFQVHKYLVTLSVHQISCHIVSLSVKLVKRISYSSQVHSITSGSIHMKNYGPKLQGIGRPSTELAI